MFREWKQLWDTFTCVGRLICPEGHVSSLNKSNPIQLRVKTPRTLFICYIMNLLWLLSDKGTHVRFCWIPSHCGIVGNEKVDQLAKDTLGQDINSLVSVHYIDLKPLVNSYIQKLVQTKWDVAVHGRDLYLVKPTLGPPKEFQHLTRAEEVVITWLRIGHTKATKSHILSRGPPTACHHCGQSLTIDHMLLECAVLQECRDEYYTVDSLNALFETIPETCIVELLREAGFFYLIWCNLSTSTSPETWTIWSDLSNLFREWKQLWDTFTCVGRLICPEGHVSSLNKSSPTTLFVYLMAVWVWQVNEALLIYFQYVLNAYHK